jgi:hypothetical protein
VRPALIRCSYVAAIWIPDGWRQGFKKKGVATTVGRFEPGQDQAATLVRLIPHLIRAIAETGVDRISIGSLTKDVRATDYSLRVI